MKLHPLWLAAAIVTPAFAIDAPVDDAPPPPLLKKENSPGNPPSAFRQQRQAPTGPQENAPATKAAFLGLVTAEVPDVLAEHLRLKIGEGIMVRALLPEGPASQAGVAVHDVILRISGQSVGNPRDLTEQISQHKVGDSVELELIHQGQPARIQVTLGERPPQVAASAPSQEPRLQLRAIPQEQAEQMRELMEQQLQDPEAAIQQLRERMARSFDNSGNPDNLSDRETQPDTTRIQSQATIRIMDDQGSVEVKSNNGKKEITVHDQTGTTLWSGPWNTQEEQAAAPEAVRERISRLNIDSNFQGNGLRFKLRPGVPGQR